MAVLAVPDVVKSVQSFLASVPEIAAIVGTSNGWQTGKGSGNRISGVLVDGWKVPTQAIVIRRAGGLGADPDGIGMHRSRLDIWTYGSNGYESARLWRTVHAALCPRQPGIRGWTADACRVTDVSQDADPIPADDVDVGWSILVTPYQFTWWEAPAS